MLPSVGEDCATTRLTDGENRAATAGAPAEEPSTDLGEHLIDRGVNHQIGLVVHRGLGEVHHGQPTTPVVVQQTCGWVDIQRGATDQQDVGVLHGSH